MAAPFVAHGATFNFNSADVGGITSFGLPEQSKGVVQTTSHDSGFDHSFKPGIRDGGSFTLTCRNLPEDAGQDALEDNFDADAEKVEGVITLPPDASDTMVVAYTFQCFVTGMSGDLPGEADAAGGRTFTIKVDGAVVKTLVSD